MPFDTTSGVRSFREKLGLTQHAFAAQIGVPPSTVYRWEAGQRQPSLSFLSKMWDLGVERNVPPLPFLYHKPTSPAGRRTGSASRNRKLVLDGAGKVGKLPAGFALINLKNDPKDRALATAVHETSKKGARAKRSGTSLVLSERITR